MATKKNSIAPSGRAVMSPAAVWTPASTRTRSSRCSSSSMSAKYAGIPYAPITIPDKADFKAMVALKTGVFSSMSNWGAKYSRIML